MVKSNVRSHEGLLPGATNHDPIDFHVGNRLRERRETAGFSLKEVASALGIADQQLQKYEDGATRISASRVWDFAQILGVPVRYFFDGIPDAVAEPFKKRETRELVRAFAAIPNPELRRRLTEMCRSVAAREDATEPGDTQLDPRGSEDSEDDATAKIDVIAFVQSLFARRLSKRYTIEVTGSFSGFRKRFGSTRFQAAMPSLARLWASVSNPAQSADIAFAHSLRWATTQRQSPTEAAQERLSRRLARPIIHAHAR